MEKWVRQLLHNTFFLFSFFIYSHHESEFYSSLHPFMSSLCSCNLNPQKINKIKFKRKENRIFFCHGSCSVTPWVVQYNLLSIQLFLQVFIAKIRCSDLRPRVCYTIATGSSLGLLLCILLLHCHWDPAALELKDEPLYMLQQIICGFGVDLLHSPGSGPEG